MKSLKNVGKLTTKKTKSKHYLFHFSNENCKCIFNILNCRKCMAELKSMVKSTMEKLRRLLPTVSSASIMTDKWQIHINSSLYDLWRLFTEQERCLDKVENWVQEMHARIIKASRLWTLERFSFRTLCKSMLWINKWLLFARKIGFFHSKPIHGFLKTIPCSSKSIQ